jgi:hypothetical protein
VSVLTIYRRHREKCPHTKPSISESIPSVEIDKTTLTIWREGVANRGSTKTQSWDAATDLDTLYSLLDDAKKANICPAY